MNVPPPIPLPASDVGASSRRGTAAKHPQGDAPTDLPGEGTRWLLHTLAISLAATTMGLARFGYSVLLPAMRSDLHWSYTQAGSMNTANALGYLVGAAVVGWVVALIGERRTFALSFAFAGGSMLFSGFTTNFPLLLALRSVGGVGGAMLFVAGATIASRLATASPSAGLVLGVYFAGVGPGILVSALLTPTVLTTPEGWRLGWAVMGAVSLLSAAVAVQASRTVPIAHTSEQRERPRFERLAWGLAAFALFGLGYIPFITFIVAFFHDAGRPVWEITVFWALLALAGTASGWVWRPLLDRARGGVALATLLVIAAAGAATPLVSSGFVAMAASAVLFGSAFLAVSAAVTQMVRRTLPPHQWALGLGVAISLFALGQVAGPVFTGFLADQFGSLKLGLAASAFVLAVAAGCALRQ